MRQRCDGVKAGAVEVIKLTKMDCRLWNGTILFTFLSFFSHFFSWYFIYFPFRVLTWHYFIPKLSNSFIFQILYSLSSRSIWKIGQSFLPPQTQVQIRLTIFVHWWTCQKSSVSKMFRKLPSIWKVNFIWPYCKFVKLP